jgi:ketosteroid isomerase-like protein
MAVIIESNSPLTEDERRNIEIVRSIYRSFLDGNLEAVVGAMSPSVKIVSKSVQPEQPSYAGSYDGKANVAMAFATFQQLVQYQEPLAPLRFSAKANRVLAIGADRRTTMATGDESESRWTMIWTLEQGLVTELRVVEDTIVADSV